MRRCNSENNHEQLMTKRAPQRVAMLSGPGRRGGGVLKNNFLHQLVSAFFS